MVMIHADASLFRPRGSHMCEQGVGDRSSRAGRIPISRFHAVTAYLRAVSASRSFLFSPEAGDPV